MSEKIRPSVAEDKTEKPESFLCLSGVLGCRNLVSKDAYWFSANLCRRCVDTVSFEYGVDKNDAGIVETCFQNLAYYFDRFEEAKDLQDKTKIRALILASGVAVRAPSETETQWADFLKGRFPYLGKSAVEINAGLMVRGVPG